MIIRRICCGTALVPPCGLVYGCAISEPPGPPYTPYILPQPLKVCRRRVRINMHLEVTDMVKWGSPRRIAAVKVGI